MCTYTVLHTYTHYTIYTLYIYTPHYTQYYAHTRFEYVHVCHAVPRPQIERPHTPTSAAGGGQV